MNAITRPLGIDSTKWAVASILSKKLAAGATHAIIDIPVGPYAKVKQGREGRELSRLFEDVGTGIGMEVVARVTDGSRPIGRGIGPALEVRDVYQVLRNDPDAPQDLKEKARGFAASMLEWDPRVERGAGRGLALWSHLPKKNASEAQAFRLYCVQTTLAGLPVTTTSSTFDK